MQRIKYEVLWWILLCFVHSGCTQTCKPQPSSCLVKRPKCNPPSCQTQCATSEHKPECCLGATNTDLQNGTDDLKVQALTALQSVLEKTDVNVTTFISADNIVAILFKPTGNFSGLEISANDNQAMPGSGVSNRTVSVDLPAELLGVGHNNTIVFSMIRLPNGTLLTGSDPLYGSRIIGLSVSGKTISGLQENVNITLSSTKEISTDQKPQCVFLNTTAKAFMTDGCETLWERGQDHVTCSCDHLTYFGVLMVSVDNVSPKDQEILSYITIIGCSISLFALVITVLIFITNRKLREDDSKKIHISLAVALILLNLHFLPSQAVAAGSSTQFCVYMALGLHYSLLASFSWMALEGLHLYLMLVKVFNIYFRRYLLKLSVVGWGVPAVIVAIVVIIKRDCYGHAPLDNSNPNSTTICYITNDIVKMVTTVGVFSLVFLFNATMFGVTAKWFLCSHVIQKVGHAERGKVKKEICTLLTLMVLLGITWGLIFLSFGILTTPGLYVFCILNSLQGFFIFIYFLLSLKTKDSAVKSSTETRATTTKH